MTALARTRRRPLGRRTRPVEPPRAPIPTVTMREALSDPQLLGNAIPGPSFELWRTVLIAERGEPLTARERELFAKVTGGRKPPTKPVDESLRSVGRRGGKDRATAPEAAYLAALVDWSPVLAPGERGIVLCIAPDQRQARILRDYIEAVFDGSPVLSQLVASRTADAIELETGIAIEVRAANFRRLRGVTAVAVLATESSFWYDDDGANSDYEILNAVRPALATTGGPLIRSSSPYIRSGEDWKTYKRHFGPEGDPSILVVQGPSRLFNPTLPQRVVDQALARDPEAARAEYLGEFRSDVAALLSEDALLAVVPSGLRELPPAPGTLHAHFDAATGSGQDSAALAIAFAGQPAQLACIRRWRPPFSPSAVIAEAAGLLAAYGLRSVTIDRFAPGLVAELFREHSVDCSVAEPTTSEAFLQLLALVNSQRVLLLDDAVLLGELRRLERRPSAAGRELVGHPQGAHDDLAAAAAQALTLAAKRAEPSPGITWGTHRPRLGGSALNRRQRRLSPLVNVPDPSPVDRSREIVATGIPERRADGSVRRPAWELTREQLDARGVLSGDLRMSRAIVEKFDELNRSR